MENPIFCDHIGNRTLNGTMGCCRLDNQDHPACRDNIRSGADVLENASMSNLVADCQNTTKIFYSKVQTDGFNATGALPRFRYSVCANAPNMLRYLGQGRLEPSIAEEVGRYVHETASEDSLKSITLAVTDCLTATCRNARNNTRCQTECAGVNLLVNSSTPNLQGLDRCMDLLCEGGSDVYSSLPYADADVVGIGVSNTIKNSHRSRS